MTAPSLFTLQQKFLLDHMRHTRGIALTTERLVAVLYGNRWDGGPEFAPQLIRNHIHRLRRRLARYGIRILTVGPAGAQGYMVDPDHLGRLEQLMAGSLAAEIDIARVRAG